MPTNYCIKLTNRNRFVTSGPTLWVPGEWNPDGVRDGQGGLCSPGFYHAYDTDVPEVALFLNPIHAGFTHPRVWLAEWRGKREDDGALKMGATEMRLLRQLTVCVTTEQRVAFAVLMTLTTGGVASEQWHAWAERWLSGEDRSHDAAVKAHDAATAVYATTYAATAAAAHDAATAAANAATYAATAELFCRESLTFSIYDALSDNVSNAAFYAATAAFYASRATVTAVNAHADPFADGETARATLANAAAWALALNPLPSDLRHSTRRVPR